MTTAPEPRPVMWAVQAVVHERAGDLAMAAWYCRALIDWCHAQDEDSGEGEGA